MREPNSISERTIPAPLVSQRSETAAPFAKATASKTALPERMLSVDAMRGFDMFWLIGGDHVVAALIALVNWPLLTQSAAREMDHPVWSGFHWWDVIMPTFIFISGVTIPLTVTKRLAGREAKSRIWRRSRT